MVTLLSRTIGKDAQLDVFDYQPLPNFKTTPCPSVVDEEGEDGTLWRGFHEVGGRVQKREKLVCVTSGTSYLGSALFDRLLSRGYSVRIAVSNQGTVADMDDVESSCAAFRECHGVFHTSSFTDPAGLSGYSVSSKQKKNHTFILSRRTSACTRRWRGVRGRLLCFDSVVSSAGEADPLGSQLQHPAAMDAGDGEETAAFSYRLCNHKLSILMSVSVW